MAYAGFIWLHRLHEDWDQLVPDWVFCWREAHLEGQGSLSPCRPPPPPFLFCWYFDNQVSTNRCLPWLWGEWKDAFRVKILEGRVLSLFTWAGKLFKAEIRLGIWMWGYLSKIEISKENYMYDFQADLISPATLFMFASVLLPYSQENGVLYTSSVRHSHCS